MSNRWIAQGRNERGFTLAEMIVVVFLLSVAMLGILAVFDASARINKSETEVADAQGAVRFGVYQMSSTIRMAGSGGLFVTQAVLNHADPDLVASGITVTNSADLNSYDNVETGTVVTGLDGPHPVRPGTDMIEVRGVFNSPLLGFDQTAQNGCLPCTGSVPLTAKATVGSPLLGQHINEDVANRPQFEAIDALTAPLDPPTSAPPMYVIVSQNDDLHNGCSQPNAQNPNPQPHYTQPTYRVGRISQATKLVASGTFGNVDFGDTIAAEFDNEFPSATGSAPVQPLAGWLRHAGIMEDIVYFVDNRDPAHPVLAQGARRGAAFDVIPLADDVEDMQIAYGVDTNNNEMVDRLTAPNPPSDPDLNVSNQPQGDKWVPNVAGSDNPVTGTAKPYRTTDFVANAAGALSTHCARLHGVMISLLARSKNSDPTYRAPLAVGLTLMNALTPTPGPSPLQYRRRVQTLKINLRNYAFQG
jgi:prepilin-type N-terminal cleavage/methylation domain-containing protein